MGITVDAHKYDAPIGPTPSGDPLPANWLHDHNDDATGGGPNPTNHTALTSAVKINKPTRDHINGTEHRPL